MSGTPDRYNLLGRSLHWLMAAMILAMLFIGAGMMTSLRWRPELIGWHIPLGLAILALVIVRIVNRLGQRTPPLPDTLPRWQAFAARASHWILYGLMVAMPLLGWATLSAGGFPIEPLPGVHLPALVSVGPTWHAYARTAHGLLAFALFGTILVHLSAGLLHACVLRDGVYGHVALRPSKDPGCSIRFHRTDSVNRNRSDEADSGS